MLSVTVYGRNDTHGYNLHRRAAISLNCIAHLLHDPDDEILFVDYNTPDDLPTFLEAISDTLTDEAKAKIRVLRARPAIHERFQAKTHLVALESISRNIAVRRSNPANRWVLSTNTDMIFTPRHHGDDLDVIVDRLEDGFYQLPRFELPETLWESFNRLDAPGTLAAVAAYAERFHINEIVHSARTLFDGPGDFQLMLRNDIFAIDGFDESMVHGWHVDSNLCRRMVMVRGEIKTPLSSVFGYHCDHTRQATAAHGQGRVENDWRRYVDDLDRPDLPEQHDTWGVPGEEIEELRLTGAASSVYVKTLASVLPPNTEHRVYESAYTEERYNDLSYVPVHVLPYVCDLLASLSKQSKLAYFGCRPSMFALVAKAWSTLGFREPIMIAEAFAPLLLGSRGVDAPCRTCTEDAAFESADLFLFEFGFGSADAGHATAKSAGRHWTEPDMARIAATKLAFEQFTTRERERSFGSAGRRFIVINAIHNMFEGSVEDRLSTNYTPFSSRVRHGFVKREAAGPRAKGDLKSLSEWLKGKLDRTRPLPAGEVNTLLRLASELVRAAGGDEPLSQEVMMASGPLLTLLEFPALPETLNVAADRLEKSRETLQSARSLRAKEVAIAFPVVERRTEPRRLSCLASIADWECPEWFAWGRRYFGGSSAYDYFERRSWTWERIQLLYGLEQLGLLGDDKRVLVCAYGPDSIYSVLSELVGTVVVEDISAPRSMRGWIRYIGKRVLRPRQSRRTSAEWWRPRELFVPGRMSIVHRTAPHARSDRPAFDAVLLPHSAVFKEGWGGIGLLLEKAASRLAKGGVVGFSAEVIITQHSGGRWFNADRVASFPRRIPESLGLEVVGPFDATLDAETLARSAVDAGADRPRSGYFIRKSGSQLQTTSVWFLRKVADAPAEAGGTLESDGDLSDGPLLDSMQTTAIARREDGIVHVAREASRGHFLYGPYISLRAGRYRLEFEGEATNAVAGVVLGVEVASGVKRVHVSRKVGIAELSAGAVSVDFTVPARLGVGAPDSETFEFRFTHLGKADLWVRTVRLAHLK